MLDFLWRSSDCPGCGTRGARVALWGSVKCRNTVCSSYDAMTAMTPPPASTPSVPIPTGSFEPGANAQTVRYLNYNGEERSYVVDRTTLRRKGEHITAVAAPTGQRIAFAQQRLRNRAEVEALVRDTAAADAAWDTLGPVEKQIVGYHQKHKSTSPRYEEILQRHSELRQ